jgi:hypothetical protein
MVKALAFIVPFTLGAVMIGCGFVATVFGRELLAGAITGWNWRSPNAGVNCRIAKG